MLRENFYSTINSLKTVQDQESSLVLTVKSFCKETVLLAEKELNNISLASKKTLPTKQKIITVNRSPSGHNKSKEQFSLKIFTTAWIFPQATNKENLKDIYKNLSKIDGLSVSWVMQA